MLAFLAVITQKTAPNRIQIIKEIVRSFGLNPEEILTREAIAKPHRTVVDGDSQVNTLMSVLKQKLKQELAFEIPRTV